MSSGLDVETRIVSDLEVVRAALAESADLHRIVGDSRAEVVVRAEGQRTILHAMRELIEQDLT
jgi:hypothetical protein